MMKRVWQQQMRQVCKLTNHWAWDFSNSTEVHAQYNPPKGLEVVYEDEDLVAVNKPSGLLTVPGRNPWMRDSVFSRVMDKVKRDGGVAEDVEILHRLDMETSGVIILSKTKSAARFMHESFRERRVGKVYHALAHGIIDKEHGTISLPLKGDWKNRPKQMVAQVDGKPAETHYKVLKQFEKNSITLVELSPTTGRTHQLRVHLQALGCPILGDTLYAEGEALSLCDHLCLHASKVSFAHPKKPHQVIEIAAMNKFEKELETILLAET